MSDFKFGDLVRHEIHGLGVVALGSIYFEDGDIYAINIAPTELEVVSRYQEWIKFDIANPDCCPKIGGTYLVANKNTKPFVYTFKHDLADWSWFTHWMPLPEPPKELL